MALVAKPFFRAPVAGLGQMMPVLPEGITKIRQRSVLGGASISHCRSHHKCFSSLLLKYCSAAAAVGSLSLRP